MLSLALALLGGCVNASTLSPEQATGTAIVAQKYTAAAEMTTTPATPAPTSSEIYPTLAWTPSSSDIVPSNSGSSYKYWITSRFMIVLNEVDFPQANLVVDCVPPDILGRVSNIPPVPSGYYVLRYEGTALGTCTIRNGDFVVTINIVEHP